LNPCLEEHFEPQCTNDII